MNSLCNTATANQPSVLDFVRIHDLVGNSSSNGSNGDTRKLHTHIPLSIVSLVQEMFSVVVTFRDFLL
jgi:hypothetical protein